MQTSKKRKRHPPKAPTSSTRASAFSPDTVKRTGRPTKQPEPATRVSLGLKVTADLKMKIEAAALASGRTQSQEVELRVEKSFHNQALLNEILDTVFGKPLAAALLTIGRAMELAGQHAAFSGSGTLEGAAAWFDDAAGFDQAAQAAYRVLGRLRPPGDPEIHQTMKHLGVGFANGCLNALARRTVTIEEEEWAEPLRDALANRIDRANRQPRGEDK